jgi:hypothetical protein
MNLNAIALAADSAMTVKRWKNGKEQTRFFKGRNKIFQLSNHHPIGLMIFDSASMEDVPWELIVKEFRTFIRDKSFNELEGYATELFTFIESNLQVFPLPYRETIFKNDVDAVIGMYLYEASHLDNVKNAQTDENKRDALDDYFHSSRSQIDDLPVPTHFSEEVIEYATNSHKAILEAEAVKSIELFNLTGFIDASELVILAVKTLFKNYMVFKSKTGIVVAGYGDSEISQDFANINAMANVGQSYS